MIVSTFGAYVAVIAAAFLLGNLRTAAEARIGLAIVVGGAAIVVYNDPNHTVGDFLFVPALFAIADHPRTPRRRGPLGQRHGPAGRRGPP